MAGVILVVELHKLKPPSKCRKRGATQSSPWLGPELYRSILMSRGFIAAALPKTASLLQASDNEHPGHDLPQLVGSVRRKPLLLSLRLGHTHTQHHTAQPYSDGIPGSSACPECEAQALQAHVIPRIQGPLQGIFGMSTNGEVLEPRSFGDDDALRVHVRH